MSSPSPFETFSANYKALSELPVPAAAVFFPKGKAAGSAGTASVQITSSIRDNLNNTKRTVRKHITIVNNGIISAGPLDEISLEVIGTLVSPSGLLQATLREASGNNGKKKLSVEIWNLEKSRLEAKREVTEAHGSFYNEDQYLSSLAFSPAENALVYTAEAKEETDDLSPIEKHYEKFRYKPSFGEGFPAKKRPTLFILRWDPAGTSTTLAAVKLPHRDIFFTQAVFHPFRPNTLYAIGWEQSGDGKILGILWCFNRPSGLWEITISPPEPDLSMPDAVHKLEGEFTKITPSDVAARSPRLLHSGDKAILVWLANPLTRAHASTVSVHSLDLQKTGKSLESERTVRTVLETVWEPDASGSRSYGGQFPGFYPSPGTGSLPNSPFLRLGGKDYLATDSSWGSRQTILLIDLHSKNRIVELTPPTPSLESWSVLATDGKDQIICSNSSPITPAQALYAKVESTAVVKDWVRLEPSSSLPETLQIQLAHENFRIEILPVPDCHPAELILIHPLAIQKASNETLPAVLSPHGGPHIAAVTSFSPGALSFALSGFTFCFANYTGSLGFGEKYVQALIGQCGKLDIRDSIQAIKHVVKLGLAEERPGKLFYLGGSHGGYIGGLLLAHYPDTFTAAALHNPVISCVDVATTDIPDWYYGEFGSSYYPPIASSPDLTVLSTSSTAATPSTQQQQQPPSSGTTGVPDDGSVTMSVEAYETLLALSPISQVKNVKANVLLHIGGSDKRVPPPQGLAYYHALRTYGAVGRDSKSASSRQVELLWFEGESHLLDGVEASRAVVESSFEWLSRSVK